MRVADADRATRLLDDAEVCALAVKGDGAASMAAALAELGAAVLADDAELAARLFDTAEATAAAMWSRYFRAKALSRIVPFVAGDPDRTKRVIEAIKHPGHKATAQFGVALALASTEPHRAEVTAMAMSDKGTMFNALAKIAPVIGRTTAGPHRSRPGRGHRR